ncbi:unnamed protein product, partial [Closterium sp. NIES-54]
MRSRGLIALVNGVPRVTSWLDVRCGSPSASVARAPSASASPPPFIGGTLLFAPSPPGECAARLRKAPLAKLFCFASRQFLFLYHTAVVNVLEAQGDDVDELLRITAAVGNTEVKDVDAVFGVRSFDLRAHLVRHREVEQNVMCLGVDKTGDAASGGEFCRACTGVLFGAGNCGKEAGSGGKWRHVGTSGDRRGRGYEKDLQQGCTADVEGMLQLSLGQPEADASTAIGWARGPMHPKKKKKKKKTKKKKKKKKKKNVLQARSTPLPPPPPPPPPPLWPHPPLPLAALRPARGFCIEGVDDELVVNQLVNVVKRLHLTLVPHVGKDEVVFGAIDAGGDPTDDKRFLHKILGDSFPGLIDPMENQ